MNCSILASSGSVFKKNVIQIELEDFINVLFFFNAQLKAAQRPENVFVFQVRSPTGVPSATKPFGLRKP